jgi:hypothetical protein
MGIAPPTNDKTLVSEVLTRVFVERTTRFELATLTLANVHGPVHCVAARVLTCCCVHESVHPVVPNPCSSRALYYETHRPAKGTAHMSSTTNASQ